MRSLFTGLRSFQPQSPETHAIFSLWGISLVVFALIFAIVTGIIVYSLMRYRWREGEPEPKQVAGNRTVEVVWTVIPLCIVVTLFALTARTMNISDPAPAPAPDLVVTGHQWWWEARYTKSGVVTANEIHLPTGKGVCLDLESTDVLHEFWVPELARKMTTVPGHPNHIWIEADRAGTYLGVCSEFCGTEHAWMRFTVVAEAPEEFEAWQRAQLKAAAAPAGEAGAGMALFDSMSCVNCHAIKGTGANARVGPDLTHFASRKQFGGGIAENTRENVRRWLKNPQEVKPGAKMPNFEFNDQQLTELVDYIETLK